ncbi:MAG: cysteine peptidase family C39 domain-containing protein [Pseudomonadota bacterium]
MSAWYICSVIAFQEWGYLLMFALLGIMGALVGSFLFIAQVAASLVQSPHLKILCLCATWIVLGETALWLSLPVPTLSLAFSIRAPELLQSASYIGATGIDAILLALSYAFLNVVRSAKGRMQYAPYTLLFAAFFTGELPTPSERHVTAALIQPSLSSSDYQQAYWSLYKRNKNVDTIDELVRASLKTNPDIVVVPETGNDVYNTRLSVRRQTLQDIMRGQQAALFFGGKDLTPAGEQFNIVSHFSSLGWLGDIRKKQTVPFAEGKLSRGAAGTFNVNGIPIGIAICYESLFSSHMSELVALGSEAVIVVTNDSAFGYSGLEYWHLAYTAMRAVEYRRSTAFASNSGTDAFIDYNGNVHRVEGQGKAPGTHLGRLGLNSDVSPYAQYSQAYLIAALLLLLIIFASGIRRLNVKPFTGLTWRTLIFSALVLLIAPAVSSLVWRGCLTYESPNVDNMMLFSGLAVRRQMPADNLSALFLQSSENTCGAAALAFSLTFLGDEVFEADLVEILPSVQDGGYSLLELKNAAERRGFSAVGYRSFDEITRAAMTTPYIVHLNEGHFVVVLSKVGSDFLAFDPAQGITSLVDASVLEQASSGYVLKISTAHLDSP